MLSDERIRQIAMEYWSGTCGTRVPDMEKAIRAALAEAAQVPVIGEAVGFVLLHEDGGKSLTFHDNTGELPDGWSQHKLIIQPSNSIPAAALPPGFVAVPVEPTPKMQAEAWAGIEAAGCLGMNYNEAARKVWADMLAARPDKQP